jgi:hypothetical protein
MGRLALSMSKSVDGFIAGPVDELMPTGVVITGTTTGDFAGYGGGDHHHGVPIFVPAHKAPAGTPPGGARFVTGGTESCTEPAKKASARGAVRAPRFRHRLCPGRGWPGRGFHDRRR